MERQQYFPHRDLDPPENPDDLPVPDYFPDLSVPTREPKLVEEDLVWFG